MRIVLAAVLAGVLAGGALAAGHDPRQRHTAAGMRLAEKVLLRQGDLGKGWKQSKAQAGDPGRTVCASLRPNLSTLVETGFAQAPGFELGQLASVGQTVRVFASARQAATAWSRTVTIGLPLCLQKELQAASFAKATVLPAGIYRLDVPKLAPRVAGFRVVAAVQPKDEAPFKVYADVLVLGRGAAMTTVTLTGFLQPVGKILEQRIARTLADRLGAGAGLAG